MFIEIELVYLLGYLDVDFLCVFLELCENLVDVVVVGESHEDLNLHCLDVDRVVEVTKKVFDLLFEHVRSLLEDQVDVLECDKHDFRLKVQKRNQRTC